MIVKLPNATGTGRDSISFPTDGNHTEYSTIVSIQRLFVPTNVSSSASSKVIASSSDYSNAGATANTATSTMVTISGRTELTAKSVRRVLIKVEMPYASIGIDANGLPSVDRAKSGAMMSAHLVVTLPAQAYKDLSGSATTRSAVLSQAAILKGFLEKLIATPAASFPPGDVDTVYTVPFDAGSFGSTTSGPEGGDIKSALGWANNSEYGLTLAGSASALTAIDDPILRGVSGLNPFTDSTVIA